MLVPVYQTIRRLTVTFLNRIRVISVLNLDRDRGYHDMMFMVSQSSQADIDIVIRFDHNGFLPNPAQFIIHLSFYNLMLCRLCTDR
jgi:hypothetical protein